MRVGCSWCETTQSGHKIVSRLLVSTARFFWSLAATATQFHSYCISNEFREQLFWHVLWNFGALENKSAHTESVKSDQSEGLISVSGSGSILDLHIDPENTLDLFSSQLTSYFPKAAWPLKGYKTECVRFQQKTSFSFNQKQPLHPALLDEGALINKNLWYKITFNDRFKRLGTTWLRKE